MHTETSDAGQPVSVIAPSRRVLLVAPSPPPYGGMALQARMLERLLRLDGHDVVFFASNWRIPKWLSPADRLPGVRTFVRSASIWVRMWRDVPRVDVVHVLAASWLYFFLVVYPAVLVGRVAGKRVIVNYRGGEAGRFFRLLGWAVAPAFKLAGTITAPSEFLGEIIRKRFGVPVSIVPNIVDANAFRYRERAVIRPNIVVARHLEKIYDSESVLKAFRIIRERYPEASLWIAGTGSERERLHSLVAEWNIPGIRFLGHVRHADLPAIYDECDVFLNASRVDNFPGALVEASAAGLVVVSTWAGGIPSIYENGETALLVEPGDWEGLANAVLQVLEDPCLAARLARRATAVAAACDWRQVRKRLYSAYGIAFGRKGAECTAG